MEESNQSIHNTTVNKKRNDWKVLSGILALVIIALLVVLFYGRITGNAIAGEDAGQKLTEFLNTRTGGGVEYVSNEDIGNLYEITVSYQGQDIPVFITKDGQYFVQGAVPITGEATSDTTDTNTNTPAEVVKSDKPVAELFVMTHCPYGTQAEKGFLPAVNALGPKVDAKVRFVHYFMHGDKEELETYNQVCIREEQASKFNAYLSYFLEDGNTSRCLTKTGIDQTKLKACLADDNKKAKEYYAVDKGLSEKYGVQGSPTLVINGAQVNSGRDATSFQKTICNGFNTAPESECSKTLSTASPSAGFGTGSAPSGSNSAAQC